MFVQIFASASIKENIEARVAGPLWGNSSLNDGFSSQRVNNIENDFMVWRHYGACLPFHL